VKFRTTNVPRAALLIVPEMFKHHPWLLEKRMRVLYTARLSMCNIIHAQVLVVQDGNVVI
jgi:hypothetical protein